MATRAMWKHIHSTLERIMELEGTDEEPERRVAGSSVELMIES